MEVANDYHLFEGRPHGLECTDMEVRVYDFLDGLGVGYKTLKHPAAFTIEECNKVRDAIKAPVFKNLFLTNKQQTKFYLLLMPGEKVFKTKYLSAQINSARLSFAGPDKMMELLGVTPGSVTPMGLINDKDGVVNLLIDSDLQSSEEFACHPCINSASVVMAFSDLISKVLPATGHPFTWVDLPSE